MENNIKAAKQMAKQLSKALAALPKDQPIDHSMMLEIVAKGFGKRNWHAFLAEQEKGTSQTPTPLLKWTPLNGKMSNAQYCTRSSHCPVCGSDDISGESVEVDSGGCWQEISCGNCTTTWNDTYMLTGFAELEPNPEYLTPAYAEVFAIQRLLLEQKVSLEDTLPDWILDVCLEERLPLLNTLPDSKEQDAVLFESEQSGADIINEGAVAQLYWLRSQYPSISAFMHALTETTGINLTPDML
ncbi:MAG: glyoxalase superfamily protein [Agitococcus sp.]|nr:glyoxalase superfamily protein [Agitococcus sp.]MDO9177168.1 glyoxalase superfamily protein [Agitococcus sp.]